MPEFSVEQLKQIFQRLDADGSGRIDVYELQKIVQRHLPDHDAAHAAALRLIEQVSPHCARLSSIRHICRPLCSGFIAAGAACRCR
jgi:hypothetical protein